MFKLNYRVTKALWLIFIACGCLVLTAICVRAHTVFQEWRVGKLVNMGETAMRSAHYAEASLSARRALQIEPGDLSARKLMAALLEAVGDPTAVTLRGEIAHASGESVDSLIAYVGTALRFARYPLAKSVLARISASDQHRADFQSMAGALALEMGNLAEAERHYAESVRVDPENRSYQIQMSIVQVMSDDYFVRKKGRQSLLELSTHSECALPALRALAKSLLQTGERTEAARVTSKLVQLPGRDFADRITHLTLLRESTSREFQSQFAALKADAKANISEARTVLFWMSSTGLPAEALIWARADLSEYSELPDFQPALATCYVALADWDGLEEVTQSKNWAQFEYLRHAFLSRGLREKGDNHLSTGEWSLALSDAGTSTEALTNLWNLADGWKWYEEEEDVLLLLVDKHPEIDLAFKTLSYRYLKSKNTEGLLKLAACRLRSEPENEDAMNDLTYLSLLLGKDLNSATRTAQLLYKRHPENPSYASTLALALESNGQTDEASRILEGLPIANLQEPSIAAAYARVLLERHLPEDARPYLEIARNSNLLPEERALADETRLNAWKDGLKH
jgi:Flp pilus assembly protein TadD